MPSTALGKHLPGVCLWLDRQTKALVQARDGGPVAEGGQQGESGGAQKLQEFVTNQGKEQEESLLQVK